MVAREGFVYEQKPLSVTRNVVICEGWSLVRVVVRQGFYCNSRIPKLVDSGSTAPIHSLLSPLLRGFAKVKKIRDHFGSGLGGSKSQSEKKSKIVPK